MAHEVETMYYTSNEANGRFVPWHGLGTPVPNALTSAEALEAAGLDWAVDSKDVLTEDGDVIPGYRANTRSTDGKVLGIVSNRYSIVQNSEAFDFTDSLVGEGVTYETAGSLRGGKMIWLLAKLPETKILDDKVEPFVCFTNSHDGMGAIRACMTPTRVVCSNTVNFALHNAKRVWSTKHIGDIQTKLSEAEATLFNANKYMSELNSTADILASQKFDSDDLQKFLNDLIPVDESASDRIKARAQQVKDEIVACYFAPDIAKYMNTKYGIINAVADFADHSEPSRKAANYRENNWERIIIGHPLLDRAFQLVTANA